MAANYNPDNVNAVLSRIETKLEDISGELKEIKKSNSTLEKLGFPESLEIKLIATSKPWWRRVFSRCA